MMGVVAHQVPDDRSGTDVHQRLRHRIGVLAQARAETTAEEHDFHCFLSPGTGRRFGNRSGENPVYCAQEYPAAPMPSITRTGYARCVAMFQKRDSNAPAPGGQHEIPAAESAARGPALAAISCAVRAPRPARRPADSRQPARRPGRSPVPTLAWDEGPREPARWRPVRTLLRALQKSLTWLLFPSSSASVVQR